jgi:hypothetical protein
MFHNCSYLELDTRFRAIRPYVYSVPLGLVANESFPLAIVAGLAESIELYQMFFGEMRSLGVEQDELDAKPQLSDRREDIFDVSDTSSSDLGRSHFWAK